MPRVFVYGTLRKGEVNHYLLKEAVLIEKDVKVEGYELRANQYYPYAFLSKGKHIIGDIYEVSDALLEGDLDELEDTHTGYYVRHYDFKYCCFIYLKGKDDRKNYPLIESGDWTCYNKKLKVVYN